MGGADAFPVVSIVKGMTFVLVELASEDALARLCPLAVRVRPTEGALGEWEGLVAVYAFVRAGEDGNVTKLRTRLFLGPLEDPGTSFCSCCWIGKHQRMRSQLRALPPRVCRDGWANRKDPESEDVLIPSFQVH